MRRIIVLCVLVLSAATSEGLRALALRWSGWLGAEPWADVCLSAVTTRAPATASPPSSAPVSTTYHGRGASAVPATASAITVCPSPHSIIGDGATATSR